MKNAIILHGAPEKDNYYDPSLPSESNAHWLPWLQKELIIRDIHAVTPEMPRSYEPEWDAWCHEIERHHLGPETVLVGHSAGAGFWVRYLSQHPGLRVGKVVLVAPWLDPDKTLQGDIFNFQIDPDIAKRTQGLTVFYSDDDSESSKRSQQQLKHILEGANWRLFKGYGHFNYDNLQGESFPELLHEIIDGQAK
jgi:predicted alpha/beta hydrolase family esterase